MEKKLFKANITQIDPIIDSFGKQLIPQKVASDSLSPKVTKNQMNWLNDNLFKGTMAAISTP